MVHLYIERALTSHKFLHIYVFHLFPFHTHSRAVAYCGRDCALADWDYHKKMCRHIEREEARFADFVTLTSPNRKEALETQRMIRLCVNRVASFEDPEEYLDDQH